MNRVREGADLPRFTVQKVGRGVTAHARVMMNGHVLKGVNAIKVERLAAGIHRVEIVLLSSQVTVLPDAND